MRIRGRQWMRIIRNVLADEPLCRMCKTEGRTTRATVVDHIIPVEFGGDNERDNLQPLCTQCHGVKTATDMGYKPKGCDEYGWPTHPGHPHYEVKK